VVRLSEVAVRAGVSTSTASRALNRPDQVSPAAVARVQEVAAQLGYAPNPFARSLRVQESRTLGLVVSDATNPFFAEVARGIEAACFRAGYTLILGNADRSHEREAAQARVLYQQRVDGVLLFNLDDGSAGTITWLLERQLPVVLVERRSPGPPADAVLSDNPAGVREAVRHLADLGHRRIACLAGDVRASHYAERVAAFRAAVAELGLAGSPAMLRTGLLTYADGQQAATELLGPGAPAAPTALLCTTDTLAIGALRGAAVSGRRVPQDVAVVGYGNTEVTAYCQPTLTCVAQDKPAVGARAVRVLLRRVAQRAAGRRWRARVHRIPTRLVVRESTAGAAGPARAAPRATAERGTCLAVE
jgi:LacI family transcriptional regulator